MKILPGSLSFTMRNWALVVATLLLTLSTVRLSAADAAPWLSPSALVAAPDGKSLYVACATGNRLLVVDPQSRQVTRSIPLPDSPTGLALSPDGRTLVVTCAAPQSKIVLLDPAAGTLKATLAGGHTAYAPVFSPDGARLFVCNRFNDSVSEYNLATGKETRQVKVQREPVAAAITRDGKRLLVANHLHNGAIIDGPVAGVVSVIDTESGQVASELKLPSGSGLLNDIQISPDGKYAVVSHALARFRLPTTQLDRGWMSTNAKTLIALDRMAILNTVLLDSVDRGAANPWGVAWSADGKTVVVALAGTHEVSITDFPALLDKLALLANRPAGAASANLPYVSASRESGDVPNDLAFLVGVRERRRLPEGDLGPRGVVVVGRRAYTANYFSDTLSVIELDGQYPKAESIPLGPKPEMTLARKGELYFHDARICFQGWQSCATCHPGDARVDALNWDLLNDGLGNPKNNKSLLLAFQTPPSMSIGIRESAEAAVRAGIRHILFTVQPPEVAEALDDYVKSLKPVPSPFLVNGQLSEAARRGEEIFNKSAGCAQCHPGPLFTDLQQYDVGTHGKYDREVRVFDTPTLVEIWRTAPYLHDGSAATLREVLIDANKQDEHGKTSQLNDGQIQDLIQYLLSL